MKNPVVKKNRADCTARTFKLWRDPRFIDADVSEIRCIGEIPIPIGEGDTAEMIERTLLENSLPVIREAIGRKEESGK